MDPQPFAPPTVYSILNYWRLLCPNGQMLLCTSYRTDAGLELRAGFDGEAPMLHADVASHAEAQELAEMWRQEIRQYAAA
jgi:hypothetical protein